MTKNFLDCSIWVSRSPTKQHSRLLHARIIGGLAGLAHGAEAQSMASDHDILRGRGGGWYRENRR